MNKFLAGTCLIAMASTVSAEQTNKQDKFFDQSSWGVSVHSMAIDSQVALINDVSEDLLSLNFFLQGQVDNILMAGGIGLLNYKDHGKFNVAVQDQFGKNSTQSASASGVDLNVELGYRYQVSNFNMDLLGGYSYFNSSRSVSNCSDCPEQDLTINAGAYVKPRIGYQIGKKWSVDLSYTSYVSADVSNNIGLVFSFKN